MTSPVEQKERFPWLFAIAVLVGLTLAILAAAYFQGEASGLRAQLATSHSEVKHLKSKLTDAQDTAAANQALADQCKLAAQKWRESELDLTTDYENALNHVFDSSYTQSYQDALDAANDAKATSCPVTN